MLKESAVTAASLGSTGSTGTTLVAVSCVGVISWELYALATLVIKQMEHASASHLLSAHSAISVCQVTGVWETQSMAAYPATVTLEGH